MKKYKPTPMMANQEGSISEQFDEFIFENGTDHDSFVAFFSFMNSYLLAVYGSKGDLTDELKNDVVEFYDHFCLCFPERKDEMNDSWKNVGGPVVFRLAKAYKDWKDPEIEVVQVELPDGGTAFVEAANADVIDEVLQNLN